MGPGGQAPLAHLQGGEALRIGATVRARGHDPQALASRFGCIAGAEADVQQHVEAVPTLAAGGVTELVVDICWEQDVDLNEWHQRLRGA